MNLTQMHYFTEVCRIGNITRAAHQMHISQPAVSMAIKELEQELDVALLIRNKKSLVLTPEGELFLERSRLILEQVDRLKIIFSELARTQKTVHVGIPAMIGSFLYPYLFDEMENSSVTFILTTKELGSDEAKDLIRKDDLTLALITMGKETPPGFESEILFKTQMNYCVGPEHPHANRSKISFNEIAQDELILYPEGYYSERLIRDRFRKIRKKPKIKCITSQLSTIKSFVQKNSAGAFMLPQVIEDSDGITQIPIDPPLLFHVAVIWRKGNFLTKQEKTLIRCVKKCLCDIETN